MAPLCLVCGKVRASFGQPDATKPERCGNATCRLPGDVDIANKNQMCLVCGKVQASFAQPSAPKAERCGNANCRLPGDVNIRHKNQMCLVCGKVLASFAQPGATKPERCGNANCRLLGDVDVKNKNQMCLVCGKVIASFAQPGAMKSERCGGANCRLPGDVNIKNKSQMCLVCGKVTASFAQPGATKPERCGSANCRLPGDVDISNKNKMCLVCGKVIASFAQPGATKPERCGSANCRLTGDVDIKNKSQMCWVCGKVTASFAQPGATKPERCGNATCRLPGDVDVRTKSCDVTNCTRLAYYGTLFSPPSRCSTHSGSLLPKKLLYPHCSSTGCKQRPCWTDQPDNYPLRCEDHMLEADKNVVERACSQCGLMDFIQDGNVCNTCCLFEVKKRQKTKELAVKVLLEAESIKFVHDLRPEDGCGKARPDFVIDCGTHIIIIEVDEFQHRRTNYDCRCEQVRTINLFQEYGGLRVMFIRYNPDNYLDNSGRKLKGSSAANHKRLMTLIQYTIKNVPEHPLTVRYLCYDQDDGKYDEFVVDYEAGLAEQIEGLAL